MSKQQAEIWEELRNPKNKFSLQHLKYARQPTDRETERLIASTFGVSLTRVMLS